ncbi:hypothetical protein M5K25_024737 [Dendrobium thyrsiflorum]|uniref:Reverse transcriptase zinc-binding domain-containing protein n=1 Tax=Dendrobium thyrsiflorum TaxID=117978 RepID=A0ABD0U2P2_DENTH
MSMQRVPSGSRPSISDDFTTLLAHCRKLQQELLPQVFYLKTQQLWKKFASKFLFFGDALTGRKLHMVAWVNVCKPKSKGGLGLHSIPALIYGFNCSLILRFSNFDYPLAAWITAKYGNPWQTPPRLVSPFWKAICSTADEAKVNFFFDNNAVKWKGLNKHNFSDFMEGFYSTYAECYWAKSVWHRKSVLRFSVFGWLALVGGLKTSVELSRRNIQVDLDCVFCHNAPESISHLFFDCNFSHSILSNLIPAASSLLLRPNIHQLLDWIVECPNYNEQTKCFYYLITCCVIYFVWRERNNRKFGNCANSHNSDQFLQLETSRWHVCNRGIVGCCGGGGAHLTRSVSVTYPWLGYDVVVLWLFYFAVYVWKSYAVVLGTGISILLSTFTLIFLHLHLLADILVVAVLQGFWLDFAFKSFLISFSPLLVLFYASFVLVLVSQYRAKLGTADWYQYFVRYPGNDTNKISVPHGTESLVSGIENLVSGTDNILIFS